jgi:DNA gyrase subunit A
MSSFSDESNKNTPFELVTVLENGFGKRTSILKNFPIQKRGGYGVIASRNSEKTGKVVEAMITENVGQDLIIASKNGQMIRIPMKSAKLLGRDTQGVRLMRLASADKVASVSVAGEEENDEIAPETPTNAKGNEAKTETKKESTDNLEVNYYDGRKDS